MIEDGGLTCTVGVTGVEVQGKFMGDLRARMKMRFLPHDHVCMKKKGSMVYGIYQASHRSYSVLSTGTHARRDASIKLRARQQVHCFPQIRTLKLKTRVQEGKGVLTCQSGGTSAPNPNAGNSLSLWGVSELGKNREGTGSPEAEASVGSGRGQEKLLTSHSPEPRFPHSTVPSGTR